MTTRHNINNFAGKNFTYIDIPANTSSSFLAAFQPVMRPFLPDISLQRTLMEHSSGLIGNYPDSFTQNLPFSSLVRHFGSEYFTNRFNFAFIRNPWDWVVAMYAFICERKTHGYYDIVRHMSFTQFVNFWITRQVRQEDFIHTEGNVDLILYKYEAGPQAYHDIAEQMGILARDIVEDTHTHPSDYSAYYTRETRHLVAAAFQKDIALGGYEFQNKFWAGIQNDTQAFRKGEDPYIAIRLILSTWEIEGRHAALESCAHLQKTLMETTFDPPHGDAFHMGMVDTALEGAKRVLTYERDGGRPDEVAAGLHDAVRGAIWPRLGQLALKQDRAAIGRMASLYPYIFNGDTHETLNAILYYLGPNAFWEEILNLSDMIYVAPSNTSLQQAQILRWRVEAYLETDAFDKATSSLRDLIDISLSDAVPASEHEDLLKHLRAALLCYRRHQARISEDELGPLHTYAHQIILEKDASNFEGVAFIRSIDRLRKDIAKQLNLPIKSLSHIEEEVAGDAYIPDAVFKTEAGHEIPIVEGYRAQFPNFYWDTPEHKAEAQAPQLPFPLFLNQAYKYSLVIDYLRELGQPLEWRHALDIGAMDGLQSRFFLADNRVQKADAIDL